MNLQINHLIHMDKSIKIPRLEDIDPDTAADLNAPMTDAPTLLPPEPVKPRIFGLPEGFDESELAATVATVRAKRLSTAKPIPEPELLIGMGNAPILYRGSMCFVCGQAGSRKTTALTLMCADLMRPGIIPNSPFVIPNQLKVLYVDTEQAEFDTIQINKRVMRLINTEDNLYTFPLIEVNPELIPAVVEQLIDEISPDVTIIDNIAHMGRGVVMDIDVAELLVRNLRRLAVTHNTAIMGVIHVNEGVKTNRPRGHGGAEAVREADLVFQFIEDSTGVFSVAETLKSRRIRPNKWGVGIDETGLPYYHDVEESTTTTHQSVNPDKYADIVASIPDKGMEYGELQHLIHVKGGIALSTAKSWITKMYDSGIVKKKNGRYYRPDSISDDEELPF